MLPYWQIKPSIKISIKIKDSIFYPLALYLFENPILILLY